MKVFCSSSRTLGGEGAGPGPSCGSLEWPWDITGAERHLLPCLVWGPQKLPHPSANSFRKNFGFGGQAKEREQAAFHVIQTEHKRLGPMTFAEKAVSVLFIILVVLWFTREPGFFLGWGNLAFPDKDGNR